MQSHQQCTGDALHLFAFKGEEVDSTNVLTGLLPTGKQNPVKPTSGGVDPRGCSDHKPPRAPCLLATCTWSLPWLLLCGLTEASASNAAMNFLRRRLSDSSFVANLPNGYMPDLQRPESSSSSPASPATERRHPQPLAASFSSPGSSLFSSFSSAMKQTPQAPSGLMEPPAPVTPVVQRPRILLVIDDAHTDW